MKTNNHSEIGWHMILGAIVFLMLVPIVFALSNSFKTLQDAFNTIFEIIPSHPTLENYRHVFEKLPFVQITLNTFLIAASVTTFKTITSLFAAYSFVYFDYKGKQFFYFIMLSTMFIPFTVTMIPNYLMISKLGLRDCIWGVASRRPSLRLRGWKASVASRSCEISSCRWYARPFSRPGSFSLSIPGTSMYGRCSS